MTPFHSQEGLTAPVEFLGFATGRLEQINE